MKSEPEFVKYPEISHLNEIPEILNENNLQVFEKLDGGNSQVRTFQGRIITGSRANFLSREEFFKFPWFKDFNKWAKSNYSFHNLPDNLIIYGEFTSLHNLAYKPEFTDKFFLIDVYDLNRGKFIPYHSAKEMTRKIGLEGVLILEPLKEGRVSKEEAKELVLAESQYSLLGREGIVIKDYKNQRFAKFWRTSANSTKEGLIDEIKKTIMSLKINENSVVNPGPERIEDYLEYATIVPDHLSLVVYEELKRSGRSEISLAEISKKIKEVVNKI
ncbi:MAG: RNA ligase family protein [Candidatus Pacearchaeota archaeon]